MSANLINNDIGTEQAQKLAIIIKEHPTLKSLCGNKGDETELDMSGKNMGADIMLVPEIVANGALTSLNISNTRLGGSFKYYDDDGSGYGDFTPTPEGPKAIAVAISECK